MEKKSGFLFVLGDFGGGGGVFLTAGLPDKQRFSYWRAFPLFPLCKIYLQVCFCFCFFLNNLFIMEKE